MDLQSIGRQLAWCRKRISQLEAEVTDLQIERDGLKLVIEEILLSPGTYEYYGEKPHPMKDDRN